MPVGLDTGATDLGLLPWWGSSCAIRDCCDWSAGDTGGGMEEEPPRGPAALIFLQVHPKGISKLRAEGVGL